MPMNKTENWLRRNSDIGIFLFRLFVSLRIIYGVIDNIFSWERMMEFARFLEVKKIPFPEFSAILSVWAQMICGLLLLAGYKVRTASAVLIINFMVAWSVHFTSGDSIEAMTPALAMLFGSILFLFYGSGRWGIDKT